MASKRYIKETNGESGWYADPFGRYDTRWWNGSAWTERARNNDITTIDPPGINPAPVAVPMAQPAQPLPEVLLPIKAPGLSGRVALIFACIVFLLLVAVLVASLMIV